MARKKLQGPSLFCEWVVGTTIPAALGPLPKKPAKRREVVTVEVITDDETEEDTLKITYPRSGRSVKHTKSTDSLMKKVRFQDAPKKSAMKKGSTSTSESEGSGTESGTDASSDSAESSKSEGKGEEGKKAKALDKSSKGKKGQKGSKEASSSEDDSEPHPTCKCPDCVRGRQRQQESSSSSIDDSAPKSNGKGSKTDVKAKAKNQDGGKSKRKGNDNSDTTQSDSESTKDTENESDAEGKGKQGKKSKKDDKACEKNNEGEAEKAATGSKKHNGKGKNDGATAKANGPDAQSRGESSKRMKSYPEAMPGPHPRRPNLIEPIRAEVVQTERVVETPEDPPPNAYFDSEHNIVRIYHGPVYGNHHGRSLYPRRDTSAKPLPIGMPHPSQNPYYHGFKNHHEQHGLEHVPITQGMPVQSWQAVCPPQGFPMGYPGAFGWGGVPDAANTMPLNGNKGAFSMVGANGDPPPNKAQDAAGANNVVPAGMVDNPYYTKRNRSQFSNFGGSNRSASDGSPRNAKNGKPASNSGFGNENGNTQQEGLGRDTPAVDTAWNSKDAPAQDNTWGSNSAAEQNNEQPQGQNGNGGGGERNNSGDGSWPQTEAGQPGNSSSANGENIAWGNGNGDNNGNANTGESAQWGDQAATDDPPSSDHSNVMPGAWDETSPAPPWGDTTMAASTGGAVDRW